MTANGLVLCTDMKVCIVNFSNNCIQIKEFEYNYLYSYSCHNIHFVKYKIQENFIVKELRISVYNIW